MALVSSRHSETSSRITASSVRPLIERKRIRVRGDDDAVLEPDLGGGDAGNFCRKHWTVVEERLDVVEYDAGLVSVRCQYQHVAGLASARVDA